MVKPKAWGFFAFTFWPVQGGEQSRSWSTPAWGSRAEPRLLGLAPRPSPEGVHRHSRWLRSPGGTWAGAGRRSWTSTTIVNLGWPARAGSTPTRWTAIPPRTSSPIPALPVGPAKPPRSSLPAGAPASPKAVPVYTHAIFPSAGGTPPASTYEHPARRRSTSAPSSLFSPLSLAFDHWGMTCVVQPWRWMRLNGPGRVDLPQDASRPSPTSA